MHVTPRRDFLYGLGASLGAVALTDLLAAEEGSSSPGPLTAAVHPPRAKAVIMLFMEGGPSQVDTFDPKPELNARHLTESDRTQAIEGGERFYVGSPYRFARHGQAGIPMSEHWRHLPAVADELCLYRGCQAESLNHPEALLHMNTGSRLGGDPGLGAWVNYGLGSPNANLPGYVVMTELALPQAGSGNWTSGFLPAKYQGTRLRSEGSPILDLAPAAHRTRAHQRRQLDVLAEMNAEHAGRRPFHKSLSARAESYELAYRMQTSVPGLVDLSTETAATQEAYGLNDSATSAFGRQCLMARKMVEEGVRFVQIFSGGWDSHDYLERGHKARIESVDRPIAALIADLRRRGLLDETLVVWTGEFGRTPDNNFRGGAQAVGRGHNAEAMTMWMAGGGTKAGSIVGATDEFGAAAVECVHPIRDVHCTMLRLLGLDDNKLTYWHGGRYKQLSQFGGEVIGELIA